MGLDKAPNAFYAQYQIPHFSFSPSIFSHQTAPFPFLDVNGVSYNSSIIFFWHFQFLGDLLSHPKSLESSVSFLDFGGAGSRLRGSPLGPATGRGFELGLGWMVLGGDDSGVWWKELVSSVTPYIDRAPCHLDVASRSASQQPCNLLPSWCLRKTGSGRVSNMATHVLSTLMPKAD